MALWYRSSRHVKISGGLSLFEQEAGLPRFFFHLILEDQIIEDKDGSEMYDIAKARSEAGAIIRELAGEHLQVGRAFPYRSVRIANEQGAVLDQVSSERILREILFHEPSEGHSDVCR